jgi:hypothetical protein
LNEQIKDEDGLVIDSSNFRNYFFDARQHKPEPGQIMARFTAVAVFGDGPEKRDLIKVLKMGKAEAAAQVMKKIHCAAEPDCYRVCREICEDMIGGMSEDTVAKKDYEFLLEAIYYTKREYVPKDDPHWETLSLIEYDPETKTFKSKIELSIPKKQAAQAK